MIQVSLEKPQVIFLIGCPGAGKSTQGANIAKEYGFAHLSASNLLREERDKVGSKFGKLVDYYLKNGMDSVIPEEIICDLLDNAMKNSLTNKFIIEGYPRNKNNLKSWKNKLEDKVDLLFVLYLECPLNVCIYRCLQRGDSHYNNDPEEIRKEIEKFYQETFPVVISYKVLGVVKTLDANKPTDEVFNDIKEIFSRIRIPG